VGVVTERSRSRHDPDAGNRTVVERVDPLVGAVIDKRYRVDFRLAAGGFGAIYRATHLKSGHQVALKVLHREMATDPRVVARFRREGDALTSLRDPHTITAYEIGEAEDGALYIVMELLHGESLYERFRARGVVPWQQMVSIAHQICSSLAEAHARGIVHRDLKPANIHLEPREGDPTYVKVLDFGIAKILNGSGDNSELTNAGQMIGTFDYMSPEQMVGGCTTRSDIYTLGVLMYEMICGKRPFDDAVGPTSLLAALITRAPPTLASRAPVPPELDRVVMKCLEKEPEARYGDVHELQRDLHRLLGPAQPNDDEATRSIQLPVGGGAPGDERTPTPGIVNETDETRMLHAKVAVPRAMSEDITPVPTARTPAPTPAPTPVYQPQPHQPPIVFPPSASLAPTDATYTPASRGSAAAIAAAPTLYNQSGAAAGGLPYPQPMPQPMPMPMQQPMQPPMPMQPVASPPWQQPQQPQPPLRPSQLEVRPFDMAAAQDRDVWVGRAVWGTLIVIALIVMLFVTGRC
jgi:serine/threonine-protein kinase